MTQADPRPASFGAPRALAYDDTIARAIPGYALLHDVAAVVMGALLPPQARVLVIGAGTGTDILRLGAANPGWRFLGVDPSPDMLAVARARLAEADPALGLAERVGLREGTLDSAVGPSADDEAEGAFDGALCLLVTHFLPDTPGPEGKAALLARAAGLMAPGAPLMLADFLTEPDGAVLNAAAAERAWILWQRDRGLEESAIQRGLAHARRSIHPTSAARLAALLAETGFAPPQRVVQSLHVHGWVTRRRAT